MQIFSASCLLVITASLIPTASAWGAAGHEIVATIAQIHLHPSVLPQLCAILDIDPGSPSCHLAPIATWADKVRSLPHYRWSSVLHYIGAVDDYPSETCAFPGSKGWVAPRTNVLTAIRNMTSVLEDYVTLKRADVVSPDETSGANEALKFLVHFMGDMHMPLHLTNRDRGGNSDKVLWDGRVTNLHSLWDGLLIAQRLRTIPTNYTRPLQLPQVEQHLRQTIYDPFIRRLIWEGVLGRYQDELWTWVACPALDSAHSLTHSDASLLQQVIGWTKRFLSSGVEDGGLGTDDDVLCPYHWASGVHALNCDIAWPKELDLPPYKHVALHDEQEHGCMKHSVDNVSADAYEDTREDESSWSSSWPWTWTWTLTSAPRRKSPYVELDTPEYAGVIRDQWVVEKLLTQGGMRLAAVLNWLFIEPVEGEERRAVVVDVHF